MLVPFSMNGWGGYVGRVKINFYIVVKGRGFWRPHPRMKKFGFGCKPCGADGPEAWAEAKKWDARWQEFRRGGQKAPVDLSNLSRDEAVAARRYPSGSIGSGFQRYIVTAEWKGKALSTRHKIWWPAWYRIEAMWGDVAPDTVTFEQLSAWRQLLEDQRGLDTAHKTIKIWRALWNVLVAMKIARGED